MRVHRRDADWGGAGPKVGGRGHMAHAYHWPSGRDEALSACGRALLHRELVAEAAEVPARDRCGRPGCRQRWAAVASDPVPEKEG